MAGGGEEAAARFGRLGGGIAFQAQRGGRRVDAAYQVILGLRDGLGHAVDALCQLAHFVGAGMSRPMVRAIAADAVDDGADVGQRDDQAARQGQGQQYPKHQHA